MQNRLFFLILTLLFTQCQTHEGTRENSGLDNSPRPSGSNLARIHKGIFNKDSVRRSTVFSNKKRKLFHQTGSDLNHPHLKDTSQSVLRSAGLMNERINSLRISEFFPDLNEPLTRKTMQNRSESKPFESMIELSRESFLEINFDNDILNYTDRFYTNGIRIDVISPGLQMNPLGRLMVPYWKPAVNYYGLALVQNMYTPSTTKLGGILYGDRPYSAYLYLGCYKITNDQVSCYRQISELDLGIIGPNSYGEWVQRSFHNAVPTNNEPLGWEYQVQNDLVLNYSFAIEKGLVSEKSLELIATSRGIVGTLYTNLSAGIQFRTGIMNPYFSSLGVSKKEKIRNKGLKKGQLYFFSKVNGQLVGYDATLEGGLFNRSSVYTIPSTDVSRLVFNGSAGITVSYYGFGLDLEQFLLSPEFTNGPWHKWVHIALRFAL